MTATPNNPQPPKRRGRRVPPPVEAFDEAAEAFKAKEQREEEPGPSASAEAHKRARWAREDDERRQGRARIVAYPDERWLGPIRKPLELICAQTGHRPYQVFSDWLEIVDWTLDDLPGHLKAARATGKLQPFPEGTHEQRKARWMQIFSRYGSADKQRFVYEKVGDSFRALLDAAADGGFSDWLGQIYQSMELGDKTYSAQYFTPFTVAYMMAEMISPADSVHANLKRALLHPENPMGQALLLAGSFFSGAEQRALASEDPAERAEALAVVDQAGDFFHNQVLPAALPFYRQVRLNEPCIGSGVMHIAAAASVPPWMNKYNLIAYHGMDTDPLCVRMANIQMKLYGLNGYQFKCWEASLSDEELAKLHDPEEMARLREIRDRMDQADIEKARAEREAKQAALLAERAAKFGEGSELRVEVDTWDGKNKRKTLRGKGGDVQLELLE